MSTGPQSRPPAPIRLLALDVDGTLLDADSILRPSTRAAIARAAEAGIRPVLCTGRRYRRARPVALELGIDAPVVCNSGALVKDTTTHRTLWRADFTAEVFETVIDCFRARGEPILTFTDRDPSEFDFLSSANPTGRTFFDEYLESNRGHGGILNDWRWEDRPHGVHFHLCSVGTRPEMLDFEAEIRTRLGDSVRTFVQKSPNYRGTMCEVLDRGASKWDALRHLAELWEIDPTEICAVGDDMNDVPMILVGQVAC